MGGTRLPRRSVGAAGVAAAAAVDIVDDVMVVVVGGAVLVDIVDVGAGPEAVLRAGDLRQLHDSGGLRQPLRGAVLATRALLAPPPPGPCSSAGEDAD